MPKEPTHEERAEIQALGGTLDGYGWARKDGATHKECLALAPAMRLGEDLLFTAVEAWRLLDPSEQATPAVCELICGLAESLYDQGPEALAQAALGCRRQPVHS